MGIYSSESSLNAYHSGNHLCTMLRGTNNDRLYSEIDFKQFQNQTCQPKPVSDPEHSRQSADLDNYSEDSSRT